MTINLLHRLTLSAQLLIRVTFQAIVHLLNRVCVISDCRRCTDPIDLIQSPVSVVFYWGGY